MTSLRYAYMPLLLIPKGPTVAGGTVPDSVRRRRASVGREVKGNVIEKYNVNAR